jgi:tripeptidyl-peptidase-1
MTFPAAYMYPAVTTPGITPQNLWELYGIPNDYYVTSPKFSQSVVEFEGEYYSPGDLQLFFDEMGIYGGNTPVTVIGTNDPTQPSDEASLDIQWIMAMSPGVPTTFWSVDEFDILMWCYSIGNTTNPPLVNSISYGIAAKLVDLFLGQGYLARSDIEFQKLATQGITVLIADGDRGAGGLGPAPYFMPNCTTLAPDYPSQSPYISAIGSTYMTPLSRSICYRPESLGGIDCTVGQPYGEVAVSIDNGLYWTTGGGFADTQPQPSYQVDFVKRYINSTTLPPFNTFNINGRAYPDYSAIGHNLITVVGEQVNPSDGTSASAPIFSGIVSLLNEYRASINLPPLGFINPLFYAIARRNPAAFHDVVVGQNRCGIYIFPDGTSPICCDHAYIAEIGWDAVTGLGSPNFEVLRSEVAVPNTFKQN